MPGINFISIGKNIFFLFALCLATCVLSCVSSSSGSAAESEGIAFVSGMGLGWNLGNTFDAWPNVGGRRGGL